MIDKLPVDATCHSWCCKVSCLERCGWRCYWLILTFRNGNKSKTSKLVLQQKNVIDTRLRRHYCRLMNLWMRALEQTLLYYILYLLEDFEKKKNTPPPTPQSDSISETALVMYQLPPQTDTTAVIYLFHINPPPHIQSDIHQVQHHCITPMFPHSDSSIHIRGERVSFIYRIVVFRSSREYQLSSNHYRP